MGYYQWLDRAPRGRNEGDPFEALGPAPRRVRAPGMTDHNVGTREEWLVARVALLDREKELTRLSDELSAASRAALGAGSRRTTPSRRTREPRGWRSSSTRRSQLDVYHFIRPMVDSWPEGCVGCSYTADSLDGAAVHLPRHDVTFVAVSRAPLGDLNTYKRRMGWTSVGLLRGTDFNLTSPCSPKKAAGPARVQLRHAQVRRGRRLRRGELHGLSAFASRTASSTTSRPTTAAPMR